MKSLLIFALSVSLLGSCSPKNTIDEDDLIGTWALDSISSTTGHFYKEDLESKTLVFKSDHDYFYEWWQGDVGNSYTGKYFILTNPSRGVATITFIHDFQISGTDTLRQYLNFDIIELNENELQLIAETDFLERRDLPVLEFNPKFKYRKVK